ncbi:uncharacterized protein LOC119689126 [Teleopsis dalmanni]|uniref:uncharacterized protein LOC119689126 n=1 Tax=Teleopsis dalmanni TaxID=139649 RepID=UPI000D32C74E|nr:uncharacterized protein LOC119689126 [Teleopsis dalmanni]
MANYFKTQIFIVVIMLALLYNGFVETKHEGPRKCPDYCKCSLYKNRNLANCSGRNLIDPNVEIPTVVQILDLKNNDLTTIDSNCFSNFKHIIQLCLGRNAIYSIDVDAFRKLILLNSIDLSYNRLDALDPNTFKSNFLLYYIDLEGNKFTSLPKGPFIISQSVRSLNLQNAQLSQVNKEMFSKMPQLEQLNLSGNLLITLSFDIFTDVENLKFVNLSFNNWICDEGLSNAINNIRDTGTTVEILNCNIISLDRESEEEVTVEQDFEFSQPEEEPKQKMKKFERMEMELTTEFPILNISADMPDFWLELEDKKYSEEEFSEANTDDLCVQLLRNPDCNVRIPFMFCELYGTYLEANQLRDIYNFATESSVPAYNTSDINYAFFFGTAIGMIAIILVLSCALLLDRAKRTENNATNEHTIRISIPQQEEPNRRPQRFTDPPPYQELHSPPRRREPRTVTSSIIRHHTADAPSSFLSRLLGRSGGRQAYRAFNQNTATLIRRLSRSNLFVNRSISNNANASTQPPTSTETAVAPRDSYFTPLESVSCFGYERAETPPPTYGDAVNDSGTENMSDVTTVTTTQEDIVE